MTRKMRVRSFVKAYYEYKRLCCDAHNSYVYARCLDQLEQDDPQLFARLEQNWQANH